MSGQDGLLHEGSEQRQGTEQETDDVLFEGEVDSLQGLASELDDTELNDEGEDQDSHEQRVVEEVLEDVDFLVLELSSVDFIEDLKQHEDVEEDGVVLACLIIPVLHSDGRGNIENFGA